MRLKRFAAPVQPGHLVPSGQSGRITGLAALLGLTALSACSGSASSEFSGDLFVRSCSIGCSDGSDGREVTCGVVNVTENQEISILFSLPIDPASISSSSLQVTDTANGTSPEGLRFVDPLDPRRVIFRPSIAFENGGISFSFETNRTYEVLVPGANQGDAGPFIRSSEGNENRSRLRCSVETTEGIADIVPGNPIVSVFADRVTSYDANMEPLGVERVQIGRDLSDPVTDIWRSSKIYFEFNELMFLPTVADNGTGQSPFIRVRYDRDGTLATSGQDQFDLPGTYEFFVDQISLTTDLVFTPEGTIPSAGTDPVNPNLLVIRIPSAVTDAAGNAVTTASGGGVLAAVPEFILFPEIMIPENGESFDTNDLEDRNGTGAVWANGILNPGISGGSGRLGELRVLAGESLTLNTDSTEFPLVGSLSEVDVIGNGEDANYPRAITVTDGIFEFSKIILEPSATLRIEGSVPVRLLSRGSCIISPGAIIDVSGENAVVHDSNVDQPGLAGVAAAPGPGAGTGGFGGDRADFTGNVGIVALGGAENPFAIRSGRAGVGVGGVANEGSGPGGAPFPAALPTGSTANPATLGGVGFNVVQDPLVLAEGLQCMVQILSAPGAGGGYARTGSQGVVQAIGDAITQAPGGLPTAGPNTNGGAAAALEAANLTNAGYTRRLLRWETGDLLGGSGGGGGGNHPFGSRVAGLVIPPPVTDPIDCLDIAPPFQLSSFNRWRDHSGASGGAGGGAIEITMGRSLDLQGRIDASGGNGGSPDGMLTGLDGSYAIPGGGGSGGSVRLRARDYQITGNGRVLVNGGNGGTAPWSANAMGAFARGGAGSPGLARIEDADPTSPFDLDFYASKLAPTELPAGAIDFLSFASDFYGTDNVVTQRPDSVSGATSCWIRPVGSFVSLTFLDDAGSDAPDPGWNMDVVLDDGAGGTTVRPFRGSPASWEEDFGNLLGYDLLPGETASPIVVRFQGGRAEVADLNDPLVGVDPCDLNITDVQSPFVALGSLTPWVAHPADLNLVQPPTGGFYTINMIRYCIMFDRTDFGADTPGQILAAQNVLGVDNLTIRAQPE